MDPDHVETEAASSPRFGEAEPHPSSPAGGVMLWGAFARRIGPAAIRSSILGGLAVAVVLLVAEIL
jgi:hypothetical protein